MSTAGLSEGHLPAPRREDIIIKGPGADGEWSPAGWAGATIAPWAQLQASQPRLLTACLEVTLDGSPAAGHLHGHWSSSASYTTDRLQTSRSQRTGPSSHASSPLSPSTSTTSAAECGLPRTRKPRQRPRLGLQHYQTTVAELATPPGQPTRADNPARAIGGIH